MVVLLPSITSAIQSAETVSVNDPRPLSAAVKLLERRCHCAITYEDPRWGPDDVVDISGPVIPKGGPFTFSVAADLSSRTPAQRRDAFEQVLRAFERSGSGPGMFRLMSDDTTVHVVPRGGSVLDTPVSITGATRSIMEIVTAAMDQVRQVTGHKIGLATFPINLFKRRITFDARQEPARIVLQRAMAASGRLLSWRLYYDVGMGQYYLGIHFVR
jgi:hypothetical protein